MILIKYSWVSVDEFDITTIIIFCISAVVFSGPCLILLKMHFQPDTANSEKIIGFKVVNTENI